MNKSKTFKTPTSLKIIILGNLIVNLPVTLIIIISTFLLFQIGLSYNLSLIISVSFGWICWTKLIKIWKKWALIRGVKPERLFKLGKIGLINFFKNKIID